MAIKVNRGRKVWVDGFALACDLTQTEITRNVEMLDITTFCSSGRKKLTGITDFTLRLTGYWDHSTGTPNYPRPSTMAFEPVAFNRMLSKSSAVLTVADTSDQDAFCYIGQGCGVEVDMSGGVGGLLGITAVAQGVGPLVKGRLLECGTISSGVAANVVDLAPVANTAGVSTGSQFHAAVHILGTTGADSHKKRITIQCSSDSGFGSVHSTLFNWAQGTIDATTSPGTAKYATTKVSSTKIRYVRITQKSSAGSTNAKFKVAIALGVSQRR